MWAAATDRSAVWRERVASWQRWLVAIPAPVAVLAIGLLLFARHREGLFYPSLWGEDGAILLARFVNDPSPAAILRPYNGYVSLVPNVLAWIVTKLPISMVPFAMVTTAFLISVAAYCLVISRSFRFLVPDDRARRWIAIGLAALPLGQPMLFHSLIYQLWHLLWIAVLLSAAPAPEGRAARAAHLAVAVLAICSHPLSLVIAPICGFNLIVRRSIHDRARNACFLLALILYLCFGLAPTNEPTPLWVAASYVPSFVAERVVFETAFGRHLLFLVGSTWARVIAVSIVTGLALVLYRMRQRFSRRDWLVLAGAAAIVLALTVGGAVGRPPDEYLVRYPRYSYVQQLVLALALVFVASRTLVLSDRDKRALAVLAIVGLAWTNVANSYRFKTRRTTHALQLSLFLADVEKQNHGQGRFGGRTAVLDRGLWTIRILAPSERGHRRAYD